MRGRRAAVRLAAGLCLATVLQACSSLPSQRDAGLAGCQQRFEQLQQLGARHGAMDGGAFTVDGWPQLATDRYLASFGAQVVAAAAGDTRAWWLDALARLGAAERELLLQRLPAQARATVDTGALADCAARLNAALAADPRAVERLAGTIEAPDSYVTWRQLLGLYPIPALIALGQIGELHEELAGPFAREPLTLPRRGRLLTYRPAVGPAPGAGAWPELPASPPDARHRDAAAIGALLQRYAPMLVVDTAGEDDRVGAVRLAADGAPSIDTTRPTAYYNVSYTRYGRRSLLQLSYHFWFPSRPTDDLYGGPLDALVWRVTLDDEDRPLAYDSMHGCGCYYMVFPGPGREPLPTPPEAEPVLFPRPAPAVDARQRMVLHVSSATHYLRQLDRFPRPGHSLLLNRGQFPARAYALSPYRELRRLALGQTRQRASLFDAQGLVPASARAERYLLWPLGVRSAGAMRQWGRHATAFVGRRHFDDPRLLERLVGPRAP